MDKLERVARAIDPDAFDTAANCDCEDCQKYLERRRKVALMAAKEVIAALEPVTVQEAARVLLANMHHCKPHGTHGRPGATVEHIHFGPYALRSLRALAERGE